MPETEDFISKPFQSCTGEGDTTYKCIAFLFFYFASMNTLIYTVPAIKGADIVFQTYIEVTPGQLFTYHWEGHGFKVHIPAGAISSESGPVTLSIQASLSGDYQLPDDRVLVSGVYWLALQPPVKFAEKATITIHHCAADSAISFITAKCTQETLPYTFKPLSGGCFSDPGFGTIEVDHFSAFAAVAKEAFYAFCTFYVPQQINVYDAHITVTPNSEPHLKVNSCEV